jgi:hypothetical protein
MFIRFRKFFIGPADLNLRLGSHAFSCGDTSLAFRILGNSEGQDIFFGVYPSGAIGSPRLTRFIMA